MKREDHIQDDLQAFVDGELSPERAEEVRRAIEADPSLAAHVAELEALESILGVLPGMGTDDAFVARVSEAAKTPPVRHAWWRRPVAAVAAAAAIVIAVVVVRPWNGGSSGDSEVEIAMPDRELFPVESNLELLVKEIERIDEELLPLD